MISIFKLIVVLSLAVAVFSKMLHIKEDLEQKDPKAFMNLFNNEEIFKTNERHARHVQTVTESVLDHLIKELKHQYHSTGYNSNSPIRRLIRNLNKEMKRNEHTKLMKEKLKKKATNVKKNKLNKNKKTTEQPFTKYMY
ncbi:uncharacterized protein LOC142983679 [Anticarsia gemmatalis]|uniref:uncharacterized protein LOC142983679 n=1 Tax=Anticarsia gemmatalis TaxID=129554 RepID=UPI003F75BF76